MEEISQISNQYSMDREEVASATALTKQDLEAMQEAAQAGRKAIQAAQEYYRGRKITDTDALDWGLGKTTDTDALRVREASVLRILVFFQADLMAAWIRELVKGWIDGQKAVPQALEDALVELEGALRFQLRFSPSGVEMGLPLAAITEGLKKMLKTVERLGLARTNAPDEGVNGGGEGVASPTADVAAVPLPRG